VRGSVRPTSGPASNRAGPPSAIAGRPRAPGSSAMPADTAGRRAAAIGERAHRADAPLDLAVQPFQAVRGPQPHPVRGRKRVELSGGLEAVREARERLGDLGAEGRREGRQALGRLGLARCLEDRGDLAREPPAQPRRRLGEHIALEMHHAPLALRLGQQPAHRLNEAGVLVRDHELDAGEPAREQLLEQRRPGRLAEELALAVGAHAIGHERRHVLHRPRPARVEERGIEVDDTGSARRSAPCATPRPHPPAACSRDSPSRVRPARPAAPRSRRPSSASRPPWTYASAIRSSTSGARRW
jgi:hypothetical protein